MAISGLEIVAFLVMDPGRSNFIQRKIYISGYKSITNWTWWIKKNKKGQRTVRELRGKGTLEEPGGTVGN